LIRPDGPAASFAGLAVAAVPRDLAGEHSSDAVRIHRHNNPHNKVANIPHQPALEPIGETGIEGVLHILVDGDGFIGGVEEVEGDLDGFHDDENQGQQQNIIDDTHHSSPKAVLPPIFAPLFRDGLPIQRLKPLPKAFDAAHIFW
jgi:hypothetical protein